jgi:hypothetical protein
MRRTQNELWEVARSDAFLALLLIFLLTGCGDLTSGGYGEVEVSVVSDPILIGAEGVPLNALNSGEMAAYLAAYSSVPLAGSPADGFERSNQLSDAESAAEGTVRLRTRVFLRRGARGWIEVTPGIREISLTLHEGEEGHLSTTRIPAGSYDGVRVDFRFVQAEVDEGLLIQGDTIRGPVSVSIPADGLAVFFPIRVNVSSDARTSILLEIRAQEWLRKATRIGRTVSREDFEAEVGLELR